MYNESSSNRTTSTKTTVTYAGQCYLLSWALDISFERGPVLAQFLRMSNVRETSPAFEVFNWGECPESYYTTDFHKLKAKLQKIYKLPNVSPCDVDEFGRNAAHLCVVRFGDLLDESADFKEATQLLDNLQKILWFLGTVGVDIYAGENHDGSMLEYLMVEGWASLLPRVYDVLKSRNSEFDPGFDQRPVWDRWDDRAMDRRRHLRIFRDTFHDRPDILEGNPLRAPSVASKQAWLIL
ncbi:hypothetical protein LCI18_014273 [Fusarium solani-melongenae]|uniref:Uncharacterized protein n=1 Tax=Fusarium solani subsp. cucurbitae TaxID=2747967 RepID=A0ACD3ZT81_FUSSC|nr:hypothetical protein LCI18_014273 [Fusarium solani-melongenae]